MLHRLLKGKRAPKGSEGDHKQWLSKAGMDDWEGANVHPEEDMYQQTNIALALFSSATPTSGFSLCGIPLYCKHE